MTQRKSNKVLGVLGVIANFGLAKFAPESSVRRLVSALDDANEDTSTAAYMALVKLGPNYAKQVLDSSPNPSEGVIQVLGDMGDESVIPALERFAENEELTEIAQESIEALTDLGSDEEVTPQ